MPFTFRWPAPLPAWIDEAMRHRGLKEIPGKQHNSTILKWLAKLKAWWKEDETPWCGTFVAHCLEAVGLPVPKHWYRAKGYADYGTKVSFDVSAFVIPFGAICVKSRTGGGHVFFAVARSADGTVVYGLGGNQGNMVNITPFKVKDIDHVRWPPSSAQKLELPKATAAELAAAAIGGTEA
jgi:uncharacterized protein (TIGR02594 family)